MSKYEASAWNCAFASCHAYTCHTPTFHKSTQHNALPMHQAVSVIQHLAVRPLIANSRIAWQWHCSHVSQLSWQQLCEVQHRRPCSKVPAHTQWHMSRIRHRQGMSPSAQHNLHEDPCVRGNTKKFMKGMSAKDTTITRNVDVIAAGHRQQRSKPNGARF